ncbi:MAG: M18 family aminopeptidase [Oscillospiraceae bacterium]|nr:M18 family aminopeptidase [Oscillospiraceae bacterium]
MEKKVSKGLTEFLNSSYTAFHAVENIKSRLLSEGFIPLSEGEKWKIEKGGRYFVTRNDTSVIAFKVPDNDYIGFNIVASHSDSPCFKIKENAEITQAGNYICLNTEKYGGMIMSTWFDRPLSVAGRIIVKTQKGLESRLVNVDKDLLIIPNLAIHMDRTVNDGKAINPQNDMLPLFGDLSRKDMFMQVVAEAADVVKEDIVAKDLYLYVRQKAGFVGLDEEFVTGPKLDDLQCAYTSMEGFIAAEKSGSVAVLAVFDNEEAGSGTKQGALSTMLYDTLTRLNRALGYDEEYYLCALTNSFMISADNAHSLHPNYSAKADPTNRPVINKGVVIKHHANQQYTTDAVSCAVFTQLAEAVGAEVQHFANRSDMVGGSTLGNLSNRHVSLNAVDIGLPQFAMHSCIETAGVKDTEDFAAICKKFYSTSVVKKDNCYTLE